MKRRLNLLFCGMLFALLVSSFLTPTASAEAPPGVAVSINAPGQVLPGSDFVVTVDIAQVQNLAACNYDVSFAPSILAVINVTSGEINGTVIPVGISNLIEPGRIRIVQNIGYASPASGSGTLAQIRFHALSWGVSAITLSDGILGDTQPQLIPAQWIGDSVTVASGDTAVVEGQAALQGRTSHGGAAVTLTDGQGHAWSTSTDAEGRFRVSFLLAGTYAVKVEMAGYLPAQKSGIGVIAGGTVTLNRVVLAAGDLNDDSVVNIFDLVVAAAGFGSTGGAGDLNNDGVVNILDLAMVALNFGKTSSAW